jgi:hypothetical protein
VARSLGANGAEWSGPGDFLRSERSAISGTIPLDKNGRTTTGGDFSLTPTPSRRRIRRNRLSEELFGANAKFAVGIHDAEMRQPLSDGFFFAHAQSVCA